MRLISIALVLVSALLVTKTKAVDQGGNEAVVNYLLDSTAYQGELNWDKVAFGDSMELPGWKEQSFSQQNGDVWRVHFVCDISSGNPNNWLRLPFIAREDANRINIKLEYTIRECKKYPGEIRSCKETFQLLYREVDVDDNGTKPNFDEANYKYLKTIAPNSVQQQSASQASDQTMISSLSTKASATKSSSDIFHTEVELPLQQGKRGVYLVFRDQGACVSLLSIKVYYTLCSSHVQNLVVFPMTPTGSNVTDLVQRQGHCIQNADSKIVPYAYCQTNGNWFITNTNEESTCHCRPGFFYSPTTVQCIECPQGRYKSDASNRLECSKCPHNSWSVDKASVGCVCLNGYYRTNSSDQASECVEYPREPRNLTIYHVDQASVKLRWDAIGGYQANKVQYRVDCFKCRDGRLGYYTMNQKQKQRNSMCVQRSPCESYIRFNPKRNQIFSSELTLSSLDANTKYQLEVYAQHVDGLFQTKTVDVIVRTSPPVLDYQIINITAYQFTELNQVMVLWSFEAPDTTPSRPRPQFTAYELRYWPVQLDVSRASVLQIPAPASNFTLKSSSPHVLSNTVYTFQLRGHTQYGWAPYSQPIESIHINNFYQQQNKQHLTSTTSLMQHLQSSTDSTSAFLANLLPSTSNPLAYHVDSNNNKDRSLTDSLTATVSVAVSVSFCIVIVALTLLIYLSRSATGRFNCLSANISKQPVITSSSNSDCDSLDFAKRTAHMHYNPLGTCSAGTRSSGHSSPLWPPLNSTKTYIDPHTYEDPTKVVSLFAKELSPCNIIIESVIGGGEFGDVCKGVLKLNPWSDACVAIKTLKGAATEQNRCDFLTEASIMAQFNDPNVVRLEGVVTLSHPLMIVTEYMENGSLDTFMRLNENKLPLPQILRMLGDVASGMRYLSDMNYIHRDLAARNILINRDLVCKVADFGLSREIADESLEYTTKGGKIPIRWTAPEACNFRKYSYASDVWSYGVLAWEVLTFGERPYWNWENTEVIKANKEQYRLPPPFNCPDCLYKLMLRCWQDDRTLRPTFNELVGILDDLLATSSNGELAPELRKQPKIQELMPINPRAPSQLQLTPTRQFLASLQLQQHADTFEKCGLGNLSNCFQLEAKDLGYSLNIHSQFEQQKIIDELNRIACAYQNSLNTQENYISYNSKLFSSNLSLLEQSMGSLSETVQHPQVPQPPVHQPQPPPTSNPTSIFQLIRTNSQSNHKPTQQATNSDLLLFQGGYNQAASVESNGVPQGFLV